MYNKKKFWEMMGVAVEYEWKFAATPELLAEIDAAFSGEKIMLEMETTYYDTPTGALSARHYTLRKRLENGVPVCTLKTPAQQGRKEWETEADDIVCAIPKLVAMGCPADLPALIQEGIVPVCGAKFTRVAKTVFLDNGTVELAMDRGFLMGGNRQIPLCEVEVELKSGSNEMCDSFAKDLACRFGLKLQKQSKFRRALALYRGE